MRVGLGVGVDVRVGLGVGVDVRVGLGVGVGNGAGGAGGAGGGAIDCPEAALCAARMVKPRTALACRVPLEAVILYDCDSAAVGVPDKTPVKALKFIPAGGAGRIPKVTAAVAGNPVAAKGAEVRGVPTVPVTFCCAGTTAGVGEGDALGVGVGDGAVISTISLALASALVPLIVTVYVLSTDCLGIPDNSPVLALKDIPGGTDGDSV